MTRVFIVAASPLTRAGLQDLLAARGVNVVGSSANLESLSELFIEAQPHAVLLDVSGEKTPELLDSLYLSELVLETAVVVLSDHPRPAGQLRPCAPAFARSCRVMSLPATSSQLCKRPLPGLWSCIPVTSGLLSFPPRRYPSL
jgi:hypothetical protein